MAPNIRILTGIRGQGVMHKEKGEPMVAMNSKGVSFTIFCPRLAKYLLQSKFFYGQSL